MRDDKNENVNVKNILIKQSVLSVIKIVGKAIILMN